MCSRRRGAAGLTASEAAASALAAPVASLKGVGARRAADLKRAGILTIEDLLLRFPIRYEDRRGPLPIGSLKEGQSAAVVGRIASARLRSTRRPGFTLFEVELVDSTGRIVAVWFNQRFLRDVFVRNQRVVLFGRVERGGGRLQLTSPDYELLTEEDVGPGAHVHVGRIVPVYERAGSLTPRIQRSLVWHVLQTLPDSLPDPLPPAVREARNLPGRADAFRAVHAPADEVSLDDLAKYRTPAQHRLIYEELFLFHLGLVLERRRERGRPRASTIVTTDETRALVRAVLPFTLTGGQRQAVREIVADMTSASPMNRLLQGDVGAGKTIVALVAALVAMANGLQVALMAPTEVLAEQHLMTFRRWLAATPFDVVGLTGSMSPAERRAALERLAEDRPALVIGTHALAVESVVFRRLGLVIVDEQHRFGVMQRASLRGKGAQSDVLVMTATPIPRTLALTVYGDLDVSTIRELPPGRRPIATTVRPESRRDEVYRFVRREVDAGRQAFVVYPLVEESEKIDVRAATAAAEHLQHDMFPDLRIGLLHGRLSGDAKDRVMGSFARGEIDILVSTSVIEVGVDVPNATVMIVEHAERFGLAQLHQLRGRVGRGAHASHCVLLYQPPLSDQARERLKAIAESTDGFVLAERDLALRGPGDFFGTRQSGLPTLRVADLVRDRQVVEDARADAAAWAGTQGNAVAWPLGSPCEWAHRFGLAEVG